MGVAGRGAAFRYLSWRAGQPHPNTVAVRPRWRPPRGARHQSRKKNRRPPGRVGVLSQPAARAGPTRPGALNSLSPCHPRTLPAADTVGTAARPARLTGVAVRVGTAVDCMVGREERRGKEKQKTKQKKVVVAGPRERRTRARPSLFAFCLVPRPTPTPGARATSFTRTHARPRPASPDPCLWWSRLSPPSLPRPFVSSQSQTK